MNKGIRRCPSIVVGASLVVCCPKVVSRAREIYIIGPVAEILGPAPDSYPRYTKVVIRHIQAYKHGCCLFSLLFSCRLIPLTRCSLTRRRIDPLQTTSTNMAFLLDTYDRAASCLTRVLFGHLLLVRSWRGGCWSVTCRAGSRARKPDGRLLLTED